MQTVKFKHKDGTTSEILKGVLMLEASDLYPSFSGSEPKKGKELEQQPLSQHKIDSSSNTVATAAAEATSAATTAAAAPAATAATASAATAAEREGQSLSSRVKARSLASLQLRAKNAMKALLKQPSERMLVLCASSSIDHIATSVDLVREVGEMEPAVAYAPTKFELFGDDKVDGLVTAAPVDKLNVVVMPCVHLIDHPKWLGMLEACVAQNKSLKLVLIGDATDVAQLSMIWPCLDNALHADIVLEFPVLAGKDLMAGLISSYQQKSPELLPFSDEAVTLLSTYCCRLSGDRRYIGIPEVNLQSLIFEANGYALSAKCSFVRRYHVLKALGADDFRNNFLAESSLREHRDRQLLIATKGAVVGQINGLSVIETLGTSYEYGEPVRITATLRAGGEGDVIDIERKAELAGQIHAKAMMIINGFLTKEFGAEQPLPVSASLVFEQSYSEVDGDSASLTGLCSVISALAGVPIRQDLAVTGAVDQFGDVQAVGGVNEKIEGFYRVCRLHGFTGTQGVIIPHSCVEQLVLRPAVINAVEAGKFHIFTVSHVTEAVKLLTTLDWGDSDTKDTICYHICERLNSIVAGNHDDPWYVALWNRIKDLCAFGSKE